MRRIEAKNTSPNCLCSVSPPPTPDCCYLRRRLLAQTSVFQSGSQTVWLMIMISWAKSQKSHAVWPNKEPNTNNPKTLFLCMSKFCEDRFGHLGLGDSGVPLLGPPLSSWGTHRSPVVSHELPSRCRPEVPAVSGGNASVCCCTCSSCWSFCSETGELQFAVTKLTLKITAQTEKEFCASRGFL